MYEELDPASSNLLPLELLGSSLSVVLILEQCGGFSCSLSVGLFAD
jgi:hypothetical protein